MATFCVQKVDGIPTHFPVRAEVAKIRAVGNWLRADVDHLCAVQRRLRAVLGDLLAKVKQMTVARLRFS